MMGRFYSERRGCNHLPRLFVLLNEWDTDEPL